MEFVLSGRFVVGVVVGIVLYHLYCMKAQGKPKGA